MATAGVTKVKGVDAAYYMVKDLDRATKFYNDFLGMEPTLSVPGSVSGYTFAGGESFRLYKPSEGEYFQGHGMLFAVDDIKRAVANYKARGIHFDDDGKIDESPECWMALPKTRRATALSCISASRLEGRLQGADKGSFDCETRS